jgi:hypothetical protein
MASEPDGTLHDWREIATAHKWDTLLLGNGLSINVWEPFGYGKLFDHARGSRIFTAEDRALFSRTPNFERVLGEILTAIRVNDCVGVETAPLYERYRNIQLALGHAVRAVHVNRDGVPMSTRRRIREAMEEFEWIFTTSYDLLIYWAVACDGRFDPFVDLFFGEDLKFDPARSDVRAGCVPVYFLHGALHLVVGGADITWKLRRKRMDTLLDQFGEPIPGDPQARPLLVTEGSAEDKLSAIERNGYLSHALKRLEARDLPAVVFGSGLSQHDSHITDALSRNPGRPIAISMLPGRKRKLFAAQSDIYTRLEASSLLFFDSTTHPLGDLALRAPTVPRGSS